MLRIRIRPTVIVFNRKLASASYAKALTLVQKRLIFVYVEKKVVSLGRIWIRVSKSWSRIRIRIILIRIRNTGYNDVTKDQDQIVVANPLRFFPNPLCDNMCDDFAFKTVTPK